MPTYSSSGCAQMPARTLWAIDGEINDRGKWEKSAVTLDWCRLQAKDVATATRPCAGERERESIDYLVRLEPNGTALSCACVQQGTHKSVKFWSVAANGMPRDWSNTHYIRPHARNFQFYVSWSLLSHCKLPVLQFMLSYLGNVKGKKVKLSLCLTN
jgi:hypothetical protein